MFEEYMTERNPTITSNALQLVKDQQFAEWCKDYVSFIKLTRLPNHMNFLCGCLILFKVREEIIHLDLYTCHEDTAFTRMPMAKIRKLNITGTTDADYYGLIEDNMMIEYHGAVGLKAMIFKCKWFNTTEGRGFRKHP
ncbi:unnamed protein product, partial [Thlaspi arvense]